jgi:hypothetical protein
MGGFNQLAKAIDWRCALPEMRVTRQQIGQNNLCKKSSLVDALCEFVSGGHQPPTHPDNTRRYAHVSLLCYHLGVTACLKKASVQRSKTLLMNVNMGVAIVSDIVQRRHEVQAA